MHRFLYAVPGAFYRGDIPAGGGRAALRAFRGLDPAYRRAGRPDRRRPSVRGSFLYPVSWGYVLAWSGYTDHRGQTFEIPPGAVGIAAGKIDAQDIPFLAGIRFKPGRAYIDLTAGGLWKRVKLGALAAAGTSIDPAAAVHAGLTILGGPETDMGGLERLRGPFDRPP